LDSDRSMVIEILESYFGAKIEKTSD